MKRILNAWRQEFTVTIPGLLWIGGCWIVIGGFGYLVISVIIFRGCGQ